VRESEHQNAEWRRGAYVASSCLIAVSALASFSSFAARKYEPPKTPENPAWSRELGEEWSIEFDWWRRFGDPQLEHLVETAVEQNIDLRVLAARSGEAATYIGQAKGGLLPKLSASSETSRTAIGGVPGAGSQTQYDLGSQMSWEIDVWGRARRNIAAQQNAYQASLADYRAGHLSLVSEVATAYLQVRMLDERMVRQREAIERSLEVLDIYNEMFERGLMAQTQVLSQSSELSAQRAAFIDLQRYRDLTVNGLATLIGTPAGDLEIPSTTKLADIEPVDVPAGLPSEIVSRRPDIVAAQYRLMQAVNLKEEARLAKLPSFGLTGSRGTAAFSVGTLFSAITGQLASFIHFPIFDPQVRARIRLSEAKITTAEEEYRTSVMHAFEEVENALTNVSRRKEQLVELEKRRVALEQAQQNLEATLRIGEISYLEMLEGQRSLLDAEQQVLMTRWQILIDTVSLFKALGGGWPAEQTGFQAQDSNAADLKARF